MCLFRKVREKQQLAAGSAAPPPAPNPVADELAIDPKKKRLSRSQQDRSGKSSLVIQRALGAVGSGSGLSIGGGI